MFVEIVLYLIHTYIYICWYIKVVVLVMMFIFMKSISNEKFRISGLETLLDVRNSQLS